MGDSNQQDTITIDWVLKKHGNYYELLKIEVFADEATINKAYRKASLKLHPDKNHDPRATEAAKLVNVARDTLIDTSKRREYDRQILKTYKPCQPMNLRIVDYNAESVVLSWSPSKINANLKIISYIVQRKKRNSYNWVEAKKVDGNTTRVKIDGLQEGEELQFQVIAENIMTKSEPSWPTQWHIVRPKILKPVIDKSSLKNATLKQGTSVEYNVDVVGKPAPTVTWFFNGKKILAKGNVEISNRMHHSTLSIRNIMPKNGGTYKILAQNDSGTDEATLVLSIKKLQPWETNFFSRFVNFLRYKIPNFHGYSYKVNSMAENIYKIIQSFDPEKRTEYWKPISFEPMEEFADYILRVSRELKTLINDFESGVLNLDFSSLDKLKFRSQQKNMANVAKFIQIQSKHLETESQQIRKLESYAMQNYRFAKYETNFEKNLFDVKRRKILLEILVEKLRILTSALEYQKIFLENTLHENEDDGELPFTNPPGKENRRTNTYTAEGGESCTLGGTYEFFGKSNFSFPNTPQPTGDSNSEPGSSRSAPKKESIDAHTKERIGEHVKELNEGFKYLNEHGKYMMEYSRIMSRFFRGIECVNTSVTHDEANKIYEHVEYLSSISSEMANIAYILERGCRYARLFGIDIDQLSICRCSEQIQTDSKIMKGCMTDKLKEFPFFGDGEIKVGGTIKNSFSKANIMELSEQVQKTKRLADNMNSYKIFVENQANVWKKYL